MYNFWKFVGLGEIFRVNVVMRFMSIHHLSRRLVDQDQELMLFLKFFEKLFYRQPLDSPSVVSLTICANSIGFSFCVVSLSRKILLGNVYEFIERHRFTASNRKYIALPVHVT